MDEAPVICILGPTASGKSALAELIAKQQGCQIISADSMQVYRGMDIGTAKIPVSQRGVPYHCIDILDPGQPYSAGLFQRDSRSAMEQIRLRGDRPLICGGTFLYVRACLNDMEFAAGEQIGNAVRDRYVELADRLGPERLHAMLAEQDPDSAALIHPNNIVRVVRAFEMLEAGESYADRKKAFKSIPALYPSIKIGLDVPPEVLYERIDARVDAMFASGLVEEVERLLIAGFRDACTAQAAIGYKEVVAALDGRCTMVEARAQIKQATRRYSKRQRTWLRSEEGLHVLDATLSADELLAACLHLLDVQ